MRRTCSSLSPNCHLPDQTMVTHYIMQLLKSKSEAAKISHVSADLFKIVNFKSMHVSPLPQGYFNQFYAQINPQLSLS